MSEDKLNDDYLVFDLEGYHDEIKDTGKKW